ncbi:Glutamyl-tRNA amidotransferase B subunit [Rickenella mellea]|uniref:Glutamyl-tRNA(Gln) amidotransferase subunit B, mitochondrial n=1 Tax=Rickenella mellea TaxID=50990 RepID=A0A4R5XE68_9AGAM|nr:Glutamyl-tRNA amidotransferase B subunit [Rickenella mellea]
MRSPFCLHGPVRHLHSAYDDVRRRGWELVVGIEVHAQIKSRAKLFSNSWTSTYDELANTHVDAFDAAFPGSLPRLNSSCVDLAIRTALGLNARIRRRSAFDRKHYFYSDLTSGYQITQNYAPLATSGYVHLKKSNIDVRIKQIQLEQDTAKTTLEQRAGYSVIDLNRAGTGLMEIVSEPDIRSPEQAAEYIRTLQELLRAVGSCDGHMEQGSLRCDVNVSVNRPGESLGTRCEIKNLNSVKSAMLAITSETQRHVELLERGQHVFQETRGFSEAKAQTYSLRSKEDAPDYMYMPDPNLPPLLIDDAYVQRILEQLPELPEQTRTRLRLRGLNDVDIDIMMSMDSIMEIGFDGKTGSKIVSYFDRVSQYRDPTVVAKWITQRLCKELVARGLTATNNPVTAERMGELIDMVQDGKITHGSGRRLLKYMLDSPSAKPPSLIATELSLIALPIDDEALEEMCAEAIARMPEEVQSYKRGRVKVVDRLVGHVMKNSRGTANARAVAERFAAMLSK